MRIGRFQVMAVLQAARAYVLGLPIESAKSFGLNRAIFYAAAKRGFRGARKTGGKIRIKGPIPRSKLEKIRDSFEIYRVGGENVYSVLIDDKRYFVMGSEVQTEKDFEKNVERRFGDKFNEIWNEAVALVKTFNRGVLFSQQYFYKTVYEPRRDKLAKKWSELVNG